MKNATAKHRRWQYARALRRAGHGDVARLLKTERYHPVGIPSGMTRPQAESVIEVMRSLEQPWSDAVAPVTDEWWAYYADPQCPESQRPEP